MFNQNRSEITVEFTTFPLYTNYTEIYFHHNQTFQVLLLYRYSLMEFQCKFLNVIVVEFVTWYVPMYKYMYMSTSTILLHNT